jgi:hypothetical protein
MARRPHGRRRPDHHGRRCKGDAAPAPALTLPRRGRTEPASDNGFSGAEIGKARVGLFEDAGITVGERGGQLIAIGIKPKKPETPASAPAPS